MKTLEQGTRGVMYWWRFENLPWQVAMSDLIFLAMIWARYSAGPGDLQGPYSMIFYDAVCWCKSYSGIVHIVCEMHYNTWT